MKHAYACLSVAQHTAYPYISTITVKYFAVGTLVNGMGSKAERHSEEVGHRRFLCTFRKSDRAKIIAALI